MMMRFSTFLGAVMIPVLAMSCKLKMEKEAPTPPLDEAAERTAIMETIERETACFFQRDFACWSACYAQTEYAFQAWTNADGSFDVQSGWTAVSRQAEEYMKANPAPPVGSSHPRVERRNLQVKFFSPTVAYLIWDQYNSDPDLKMFVPSKETRIMEKIDGQWRIVNVTAFWDSGKAFPIDSLR
jgi:hypothetical protein